MLEKPPVVIQSVEKDVFDEIKSRETVVICGKNNSGKSFLLRHLHSELGDKTSYLGPNRYNNFSSLGVVANNRDKSKEYTDFINQWRKSSQNIDNSPINLQRAIAELSNEKRLVLFKLMKDLLDSKMEIKYADSDNEMSQKYVAVDGYNISYTSSGFRLITSIVTSLMDEYFENVLIDEPELGISPEVQGILADFLFNENKRKQYFPHLKKVIMATHSPIFISRQDIKNNFYIERKENNLIVSQLKQHQDINSLQFFLLGNRFETLYLPTLIILVEGKCDYSFINTLVSRKYPDSHISVISCNTDNRIKEYVNMMDNMLGDIKKSPYKTRIMAVLDSVHQSGLKEQLMKQGVAEKNVIIWNNNGIEYYYPKELMVKIFGEFDKFTLHGDIISSNGVEYTKNKLVEKICSSLIGNETFNDEFNNKLIKSIEEKIY